MRCYLRLDHLFRLQRTCISQGTEALASHDLDAFMDISAFIYENTTRMYDRGKEALTPPPCAASVPIPAEFVMGQPIT